MKRSVDSQLAAPTHRIEGACAYRFSAPFGAYLLAVGMGVLTFFGVASAISLILIASPPLPLWIDPFFLLLFAASYLIIALLFGFLWPDVSWKWGLWLSVPCILTIALIRLAGTPNETGMAGTIIGSFLVVTLPACTCALVGRRCAPSDQLASNGREGFRETTLGEQVITMQAHNIGDERFTEIDKSEADENRERVDGQIPTSNELLELFQQFQ